MESLIRFLKVDITIQTSLVFLSCACVLVIFFIWIPLILLGIWQIISAIVVWSKLRDRNRKNYLIFCLLYLGVMWLFAIYGDLVLRTSFSTILFFLVFILFPIIIAFTYLNLTKRTLKLLEGGKVIEFSSIELENILDSDEVLKK